jgi:uncharacterized protein (DUF885 family)
MDGPFRPDGLPEPAGPFEAAVVDLLVGLFEAYPTWGTQAGYHRVDDRWPDLSEDGRLARLAMLGEGAARLGAFDEALLSAEERIDRLILLEEIERLSFGEEVLRGFAWDPLEVVILMGSGLESVLFRDYAPWPARGAALAARIDALATLSRRALAGLTGLPGRPVALLHLETALAQLSGILELVEASVAEARSRVDEAPHLVASMEAVAERARLALETFRAGLDGEVRARAAGEGRLGGDLFRRKLRITLGGDIGLDDLRERAWRDYHAVRAEMLSLARAAWSTFVTDEPLPPSAAGDREAETRIVRRVLDAIAMAHQEPEALLTFCEAEVARISAFCREHDVISLPDEPLEIAWTPLYLRAQGRAFLDHPGPLDRGEPSRFWITPPDASAGPDAVASYLREENDRMLSVLSIHEAIPGHFLQLAASNDCPSLARTVFTNGVFAEGWAVYVTQVMIDLGYGAHDPGLALVHWKLYLRTIVNAILDVETHAGSMTEDEAMDLMTEGAWQEPDEARAKWLRARISSTQLSTYYVGAQEMWDLEAEVRRRAAAALGVSDAVPNQRIAGGFGDTPGFDQRAHLEAVIAHGTPAIKWCRRILLGEGE